MYYIMQCNVHTCVYNHCTYVPYLSVLKPGSNTRRSSNIHRVVQQNERNKHLGLFKCRVPKLLNLINLKMVQTLRKISLFQYLSWSLHLPFGCCYSRLFIAYLSRLSSSRNGMHLRVLLHQSVGEVYTFYIRAGL